MFPTLCIAMQVDWLNKFLFDMWPYLDKVIISLTVLLLYLMLFENHFIIVQAICATIRRMAQPIFKEYIGKFHIEAFEFDKLILGTLPPIIYG